ncbi:hypothetical protein GPECTOR_23g131 [Gonium pectorale]|uniref:Uncharacterized protein n=1 Tax=Gonium pectorale TaxID=33097 RepID=A0A150GHE9_GONPE|nr:hypothetical protein GPECTOR_23g131 [Gonium pectorale]|eukprot:KXZ49045.1 hypothetical protein GPECTOR_23g131 [Gonium pectorale]
MIPAAPAPRPLMLALGALSLLLAGAAAQGPDQCPISPEQLQQVDYTNVKKSCVAPPVGSPPPCSACLCDIGAAMFSGLSKSGVDVNGLLNSVDQAALQDLFQACQIALGAQLISAAGLEIGFLAQLLTCPSTSITPACISPTLSGGSPNTTTGVPAGQPQPAPSPDTGSPSPDVTASAGPSEGAGSGSPITAPSGSSGAAGGGSSVPAANVPASSGSGGAAAPTTEAPKPDSSTPSPSTGSASGGTDAPNGGTGTGAPATSPVATGPAPSSATPAPAAGSGAGTAAPVVRSGSAGAARTAGWPAVLLAAAAACTVLLMGPGSHAGRTGHC